MFFRLFALFTIIPIIELYLLINIGGQIGALNTVIIIFMTATAGAWLAKREGFQVIQDIKNAFSGGKMPADEILHGLFVLMGAFTLLTPGFLTDALGLTMLLKPIRKTYVALTRRYFGHLITISGGTGGTRNTTYQDLSEGS